MVAVGLSISQPLRTQNQKKPTTRSNFFFLAKGLSAHVERHSVMLRTFTSRMKMMRCYSEKARSFFLKMCSSFWIVAGARPHASASAR